MKPAKSTQSLHTSPSSLILREHPPNSITLTLTLSKSPPIPPRNTFTSFYNTRGKLSALREAALFLGEYSQQAEVTNKELKLEMEFLREELLQRRLTDLEAQLSSKVKDLKKKVMISKRSDLLKYESIQNIFESLAKGHKELSAKVNHIEERVEQLENIMGCGEALRNRLSR